MTFLAPAFLIAAGMIAAGVVAIHFIVTREPRTVPLPTARFAPDRQVRAQARTLTPQDLLLLLLRVLLVLAVGAALAQPVLNPPRRALTRILIIDRSRAVADPGEVADSARALFTTGDVVVLFDSAATVVRDGATDSLAALTRSPRPGRLSPALVAALRAAAAMRDRADSFELAIISPLVVEEIDAATDSVRALWPAAVRLVRVSSLTDSLPPSVVAIDGGENDALSLALPPRRRDPQSTVRIVRGALSAADSAWVVDGPRALVHWPAAATGTPDAPPLSPVWTARSAVDTVGAVSAGNAVVVAPFERRMTYHADAVSRAPARVVARWVDGEPAAVEETHGAGCIRTVAVDVPSRGDLVVQPRFARFVSALTEPCGGRPALVPLNDVRLESLAGTELRAHVAAGAIAPAEVIPLPLVPWLLAAALLFAAGALLLRWRIDVGSSADAVQAT